MKTKIIISLLTLGSILFLSGCGAASAGNRVSKVYETNYPEGISVSIYDGKIKENVVISDARISFGKTKRQVQFIINNRSEDTYNLLIDSEWLDKRDMKISTYPRAKKIKLTAKSGKRIVLDAPNYKAQDVLINIECGSNCVIKKK